MKASMTIPSINQEQSGIWQSHAKEFEALNLSMIAQLEPGMVSHRFHCLVRQTQSVILDIVPENLSEICRNAILLKELKLPECVYSIVASGLLSDGSLFQVSDQQPQHLPLSKMTKPSSETEVWSMGHRITKSLVSLQRAGWLHCALSPCCLFASESGEIVIGELWWLHDVDGIPLREEEPHLLSSSLPHQQIPYAAPEIFFGDKPGIASDVYSLGMVLLDLLGAEVEQIYLDGSTQPTRAKVQAMFDNIQISVTKDLRELILGMLEQDQSNRHSIVYVAAKFQSVVEPPPIN